MAVRDLTAAPLTDLVSLRGRRAVVTGAGRGIGAAICRRLAEAGASVLVADLDLEAARSVAETVGGVATAVDVRDTASLVALADLAVAELGGLDIWVNNAGIFPPSGPVLDADDGAIDRIFEVNVRGTFAGAREAARRMASGGVIVNLASTTAFRAAPGVSGYAASKHAVVGLTQNLAIELGPLGIRVLAVAPTVIDTPGVQEQLAPLKAAGIDVAAGLAANPLGRGGVPDDVARVVLFCASDLAMFMTGSTIPVDAGTLA